VPIPTIAPGASFRYVRLAYDIERKINHGVYRAGEKLPSLRTLHGQTRLSITTVYHAYIELEKRGIVEPRQKSGYYVTPQLHRYLSPPQAETISPEPKKVTMDALAYSIIEDMGNPVFWQLGGSVVMPDLLPHKVLAKCMKTVTQKEMKRMLMRYGNPYGLNHLKRHIARRMVTELQQGAFNELIITSGCIEAVSLCLQAVARAGDTIVMESPTYPWFLQLIEDLKMFVLEIRTDPEHGIDLQALDNTALRNNTVSACRMVPNFHNPLGFEMAQDKKEALIDLLAKREIPVIAEHMQGGAFDRHLRVLRTALRNQVTNTALAIARYLPKITRISAPRGGLTLWVELDRSVDGLLVFHAARERSIIIFPGAICSCTGKYRHFIRISYGYPWDRTIEKGIIKLAVIIGQIN
jgi:DNA-binding transcriptional MocR family regulator